MPETAPAPDAALNAAHQRRLADTVAATASARRVPPPTDRFLDAWWAAHGREVVPVARIAAPVRLLVTRPDEAPLDDATLARRIAAYFANACTIGGLELTPLSVKGPGHAPQGFCLARLWEQHRPAPEDPEARAWFDRLQRRAIELEGALPAQQGAWAAIAQAGRRAAFDELVIEVAMERHVGLQDAEALLRGAGIGPE